jgi:hypothetical protein
MSRRLCGGVLTRNQNIGRTGMRAGDALKLAYYIALIGLIN